VLELPYPGFQDIQSVQDIQSIQDIQRSLDHPSQEVMLLEQPALAGMLRI
jgi:hypothetical protein